MLKKILLIFFVFCFFDYIYCYSVKLVTVEFPPYSYQEQSKVSGVQVEIVKKAFEYAEINYSLELLPFARALFEAEKGEKDFIFNFYKNDDRLKRFEYTDAVIENPLVFFVKKDSNIKFNGDLTLLSDYKIGTIIGYSYADDFDYAIIHNLLKIDETSSHEANFRKLNTGRIDMYVCDKNVGIYTIKQLKLENNFKILDTPLNIQYGYLGISKDNPKKSIIPKINQALKEIKQNINIEDLIQKYINQP